MENFIGGAIGDIVDQMLSMISADGYRISRDGQCCTVVVAGVGCWFADGKPIGGSTLQQLAAAIEARIAFERAVAMARAADEPDTTIPLWLVSGSDVLAHWLSWAKVDKALRRSLVLLSLSSGAPIAGVLDRRARRDLGQGAARIRVRFGQAVAERIELSEKPSAILRVGETAELRVVRTTLPETVLGTLTDEPGRNDTHRLGDIVEHPFIAEADLRLTGVRNEGQDVVFAIETRWGPLEPVPAPAWAAVPRDADPAAPWKATASEISRLYGLVDEGLQHIDA